MLTRVFSTALISVFSVSIAFADELTLKSDQNDGAGLSNTYTLVKVSKGNEKSSDKGRAIS